MFGLKKHGDFKSEKENVDEDILKIGKGVLGTVEIDIMAPLDINKSPKVHVPNLNHIGLWVDDIDSCFNYLKTQGVRFAGGIRVGAAGHKVCFIHPKVRSSFMKVLSENFEGEHGKSYWGSRSFDRACTGPS